MEGPIAMRFAAAFPFALAVISRGILAAQICTFEIRGPNNFFQLGTIAPGTTTTITVDGHSVTIDAEPCCNLGISGLPAGYVMD